jgi:preprotein translocase subunit YajC
MGGVIFLVVMLLIAWVVVILPQQRRVRAHRSLVTTLHEGDEVMTTSGILGTINSIDDEILKLEVAPGIELRVVKGAIARRMGPVPVDETPAAIDEPDLADGTDVVVDAGVETADTPAASTTDE